MSSLQPEQQQLILRPDERWTLQAERSVLEEQEGRGADTSAVIGGVVRLQDLEVPGLTTGHRSIDFIELTG